jgi:hypothetical protein
MASKIELTFERLLDWIEGRLTTEDAQAVTQAVAEADATIQDQVRWLRAFGRLQSSVILATPPPRVRTVLTERFAQYAQARQRPTFFQRISAALSFDSALRPAFAGLRSSETAADRQLVFATPLADIALNLQPRLGDESIDLIGQVLPNVADVAASAFVVQVAQGAVEFGITQTDELGEFTFTGLAPAVYQVVLSADDLEIELPSVTLTL